MRTKEDAADYRYFPDPDLPPLVISPEWVERVRSEMTESRRAMADRFVADYELAEADAKDLTLSKSRSRFFEDLLQELMQLNPAKWSDLGRGNGLSWYARSACVTVNQLVAAKLNRDELPFEEVRISPAVLAKLLALQIEQVINAGSMRQLFESVWSGEGSDIDALIYAKGLTQMNDFVELEKIIDEVLAANPKNVEEYKAGNAKALNGLVGPIMKASKGKANPAQVNALLLKKLG